MTKHETHWDELINAYLDNEIGGEQQAELFAAAETDQALRNALDEAVALRRILRQQPALRAPKSLQRRLLSIPKQSSRRANWLPALAVTACAGLVIALVTQIPQRPGRAEIAQAQQELAVAMSYLQKYSSATNAVIDHTVSTTFEEVIRTSIKTGRSSYGSADQS